MINKDLLDIIKNLSLSDKKTLSQKVSKSLEELGELAKATLPFEDAFATRHRFTDKAKILEEVADVILCVMSIAYDIDYDHEDIETMLDTKTKVWADLQAREGLLKDKIPFEIHVTVEPTATVNDFKNVCCQIGVKPILLDLHLTDGSLMKDLMTSSVFMGTNSGAYKETKRISQALKKNGYNVIREKIETIPWHPAAPSKKHVNPKMPPNCYFESHLNVVSSNDRLDELTFIANQFGAKRSRNIWKKIDSNNVKIMITHRRYDCLYEDFSEEVSKLKQALIDKEYGVDKEIIEFSIFDTKISHDASWIGKK